MTWLQPSMQAAHARPESGFGLGVAIGLLIGLHWLAEVLYPDVFPEDMRPIVRDFYRLFYHRTPADAQLEQLLNSPSIR